MKRILLLIAIASINLLIMNGLESDGEASLIGRQDGIRIVCHPDAQKTKPVRPYCGQA